jgi:3-isopropylmalate dehydrogenase
MMLRYNLNQQDLAKNLEDVIQKVLNEGFRTADLYSSDDQTLVSCSKMGDLILERL